MMKKILSALVCAAVVLSLAGCGSENPLTSDMLNPQASKVNGSSSANTSAANKPDMWDVIPEIPVTDESAFEYRYDDNWWGGMVITNYLKEAPKVRIPDTLEGKPVKYVNLSDCENQITHLILPDSVEEFNLGGQSALQYVNIPQSAPRIEDGSFEGCKSLTNITIPNNVTSIDRYAFEGCISLASITIPDSVTYIGMNAFSSCESLTSITIPDSVIEIRNGAFEGCKNIKATYKGMTYDYVHIDDLYKAINDN